jgi:hypothetical protein
MQSSLCSYDLTSLTGRPGGHSLLAGKAVMKISPLLLHVARAAFPQPLIIERLLYDTLRLRVASFTSSRLAPRASK